MTEENSRADREALIRDKYHGDKNADLTEDLARLAEGEPLAYVIGWVPFLGVRIDLDTKPLIPRPETEWWTEALIAHLNERTEPVRVLDLCAGSGAIGLAILKHVPHAHVTFSELDQVHAQLIERNITRNDLNHARAVVHAGDVFEMLSGERFDVIATNPPYIPEDRNLDQSVTAYEPSAALFSGTDGLALIRRILKEAPEHVVPDGELWLEADITNIEEAKRLAEASGGRSEIRNDQYGRPRLLVSYY